MADYVPALKAKMGDWQYYITVMKLGKIARECRLAEEINPNPELNELIQREITARVEKEMVPYLIHEKQRFYGALVVAVYGGEPEFSLVKVAEHRLIDDENSRQSYGFGLLRFDGSQIYYALDGQHRLKSIQEAIKMSPELATEEISVIILKHEDSQAGLQRTRRLFSTLNRRAKPTTAGQNIAIDEDDAVAIVSRRLVKENQLLKSLVSIKLGSKQIQNNKKDYNFITTLAAFYETNEILLGCYEGGREIDTKFKQFRPPDHEIDAYYSFLENIWHMMLEKCPGFQMIISGKKKPGDLRRMGSEQLFNENGQPIEGGIIFARPIGQYIVAEVIKLAVTQGKDIENTVTAIMAKIPMDINDAPWRGVVWNPNNQRILGGKVERSLIVNIISHALGLKINMKVGDLKQKYRDTINDPKATLMSPIYWSGRPQMTAFEGDED